LVTEREREYQRAWNAAHPGYSTERSRAYRALHPEEVRVYDREYKKAHPEQGRAWLAANPGKTAEYSHKYYVTHRPQRCAEARMWYAEHPEQARATGLAWRKANPERVAAVGARRRALKLSAACGDPAAIRRLYRQAKENKKIRCYLCGELIPMGERHVDHIIPLSKGGEHSARNMAICHASCNLHKNDKLPEEIGLLL
jgi:5-methylcytosine-specific restriction endonuclease McrA